MGERERRAGSEAGAGGFAGAADADALQAHIARLEGRITALERALERRSRELRLLQATLSPGDLVQLARIADGLPPLPRMAHQLEFWTETTAIQPAHIEATLEDLWASLTPSPAAPPADLRGAKSRPAERAIGSSG
jgi:hypothetical protein